MNEAFSYSSELISIHNRFRYEIILFNSNGKDLENDSLVSSKKFRFIIIMSHHRLAGSRINKEMNYLNVFVYK